MSTLCETRTAAWSLPERLKTLLSTVTAALKRSQQARADRHLDLHYRRTREERERYLSRASDHYELERLERAWERSPDFWRVY